MADRRTLEAKFTADTRELEDGVDRADRSMGGLGERAGRLGGILATGLAGGAVAAVGGLTALAVSGVDTASDIEESLSKVDTLFGDSADEIAEWSETTASSLGQSRAASLAAAGDFGNLFTAMGLASDQSAEMSMSAVELASDLASFNNASPEEAVEAIGAALRGEAEPMRRFGVLLDAASIEAKALEMGLVGVGDELTPAARSQAAYALIMEQTTAAQGDFARTSDGLANSQRIMAAQFEDAKAKLGAALLPALTSAAGWLTNTGIPAFSEFAEWAGPKIGEAAEFVQSNVLPVFREVVDWIAENWPQIAATTVEVFDTVRESVQTALNFVLRQWERFGPIIIDQLRSLVSTVRGIVDGWVNIFRGVVDFISGVFSGDWDRAWNGVVSIFTGIGGMLTSAVRGVISSVANIARGLVEALRTPAREAVDGALELFLGMPGRLASLPSTIGAAAVRIGSAMIDGLGRGLSGAVSIAGDIAQAVGRALERAINSLIDDLNRAIPNSLGFGPFNIDLPDNPIPRLAQGGLAFGPTLALVGDNRNAMNDPEVVAPLSKLETMLPGAGESMSGAPVQVTIMLEGEQIVRSLRAFSARNGDAWLRDLGRAA